MLKIIIIIIIIAIAVIIITRSTLFHSQAVQAGTVAFIKELKNRKFK